MAVAAAGPGTAGVCSAPAAPTFTTQTVTKYKTEYKTTKQKVTVNTTQWVDQPYEWTEVVCTPVTTKQKVTVNQVTWVDQPYDYIVCKPVTTMQKQNRTYTVCVPTTVTVNETFTRMVAVPCTATVGGVTVGCGVAEAPACASSCDSDCGRKGLFARLCGKKKKGGCDSSCGSTAVAACGAPAACAPAVSYQCVTETRPVTRTVMTYQTKTDVVEVPVTTITQEKQTGMRKVCQVTPVTRDVDVTTMQRSNVVRKGTHKVCQVVPVTKEVDVTECVVTPYTETIQVPVAMGYGAVAGGCGGGCDTVYATASCDSDCGKKRGLFGRLCKK